MLQRLTVLVDRFLYLIGQITLFGLGTLGVLYALGAEINVNVGPVNTGIIGLFGVLMIAAGLKRAGLWE